MPLPLVPPPLLAPLAPHCCHPRDTGDSKLTEHILKRACGTNLKELKEAEDGKEPGVLDKLTAVYDNLRSKAKAVRSGGMAGAVAKVGLFQHGTGCSVPDGGLLITLAFSWDCSVQHVCGVAWSILLADVSDLRW